MKKIEIEIPEGKKAEWVNNVLTLVDEPPEDITERIKTFEDACEWCKENGKSKLVSDNIHHGSGWKVPADLVAYLKLRIITCALNEGWEPTFEKGEERWFPCFNQETGRITAECSEHYIDSSARLMYKTQELAEYAATQFNDVYMAFCYRRKGVRYGNRITYRTPTARHSSYATPLGACISTRLLQRTKRDYQKLKSNTMRKAMKNEKELLNLFVDKTGEERLHCITSPFAQGGFVFATDSYICIRVKQELCEDEYEETRFPNALKVLPITENDQYSDVPLSVFEDALSEVPRSEGYPICDECDGSGEVDYEYEDKLGVWHFLTHTCPVCNGKACIEDEDKRDAFVKPHCLWLNGLMFRPEHIENVIKTAKMLGNDTLHILKWPSKDNTLFIIDIGADADPSAVRIAILPISIETVSPNEYCHKINALPK